MGSQFDLFLFYISWFLNPLRLDFLSPGGGPLWSPYGVPTWSLFLYYISWFFTPLRLDFLSPKSEPLWSPYGVHFDLSLLYLLIFHTPTARFFLPRRWTLVVPLWGPTFISFCFISAPRKKILDFDLQTVSAHFWPLYFFLLWWMDGWMADGWMDGWWMVGLKRFSDFTQIIFRWSSGDINMRKFGKSAKNFFYQKKIRLQVLKLGYFGKNKIKNPPTSSQEMGVFWKK